jgi:predicted nucleic acid-binding protein
VIVLDAAALVDVLISQPAQSWVLEQMTGEEVIAPSHQPAEVLSAIARLARAGQIDRAVAESALDDLATLPQTLVEPTREHFREALALQDQIRVLDGLYVALARDRGCPVVTTDLRLARSTTGVEVRTPTAI